MSETNHTNETSDASETREASNTAADADDAADAGEFRPIDDPSATEPALADGSETGGSGPNGYRCRVCGRSFPAAHLLVLHGGVRHPSELTERESAEYRAEYEREERQIRSFRIRALGTLVVLYFGFLFMYAIYAS